MEQGGTEATILEQAYRNNLPIPARIQNAPQLTEGLEFYFHAFLEMSTCRPIGMGEGPIPWTVVRAYADTYDIDTDDEFDTLLTVVRELDFVYLGFKSKKQQAAIDSGGKKGK